MACVTTRHPVNGTEMLKGRKHVLFSNGVLCTLDEYKATETMGLEDLDARMRAWEADEERQYDYRYAVTTGILRRRAHAAPQEKQQEEPEDKAETAEDAPPEKKKRRGGPEAIIFAVMCVTGLMSAGMSAYHTAVAMTSFGRPPAVGIITGTVMVLFSATAFTAARWFLMERGAVRLFSLIFAALGLTVVAYSMLSTLTVNYDAWHGVTEEKTAEALEDSGEIEAWQASLSLLASELDAARQEKERLAGEAGYWRSMSWARYDDIASQLKDAGDKETELASRYAEMLSSRPQASAVQEADGDGRDVFAFLSGLFGGDERTLRLFMQAVPAMFFDVIAPFALSCAVYLAERRRKE